MGAQGSATIDFTATPSVEASVIVTGQAGIVAGSHVEAFWMSETSADNDADAHEQMADFCKLVVSDIDDGTGFTIKAHMHCGLATDEFSVRWVWS